MGRIAAIIRKKRRDIWTSLAFLLVSLLLVCAIVWAWRMYMVSPPYVDTERFPVRGIDVSSHNGMMNLEAVAADGYEFIFVKATEGADFRDPNFTLNYQKARHAGLKTGAYHYFRFDVDGVSQAQNLLKAIAGRPLELGVAIDVEDDGNARGVPADSIKLRLQQMTEYLNLEGVPVTFYSNRRGYEKYLFDDYRGQALWVCQFTEENAMNTDWTYWQYDHHGHVSGIRGDVDLNVYRGNREEWARHLESSRLYYR